MAHQHGTLQADLVLTSGGVADRVFPLREGCTTIGRDGRCDVRIPLPKVSPQHCEIVLENQRATLLSRDEDLGTLLNGKVVREANLAHDDELTVGPVTFRVVLRKALDGTDDAATNSDNRAPFDRT
jgi:pSer/pThr/pTyr-binding forkhead associated (FHA) protein